MTATTTIDTEIAMSATKPESVLFGTGFALFMTPKKRHVEISQHFMFRTGRDRKEKRRQSEKLFTARKPGTLL